MYHSRAISMLAGLAAAFDFNKPYGGEPRRDVSLADLFRSQKNNGRKLNERERLPEKVVFII